MYSCPAYNCYCNLRNQKTENIKNENFSDVTFHGQKCETVTLLFIYSKALFELIIDGYGAVILL